MIIVLTDGVNAWEGLTNQAKSRYSPAGFLQNTTSTATGYQKIARFTPLTTTTEAQGIAAMDNRLLYYDELVWYPLKSNVGSSMNLYINEVYSSYGINSAIDASGVAPDTILTLDYPEKMARYSSSLIDKTTIADNLDAVSLRHRGKINVLHADGSVQTSGASQLKPTMDPGPWTP